MSARRTKYRQLLALGAATAAAAVIAGCGESNGVNDAAGQPGKQLFIQNCGSCHVLNDAETKGNIGPNLDAAFADSLDVGMTRSTVESVVYKQIQLPMGKIMKPNLVKGEDAKSVAAYVAEAVGAPAKGGAATAVKGAAGKELFAQNCGSCHTLKAAGTSGAVGPNLDQLKPNKALVVATIKAGPGAMPENLVTGKDAQEIADFVSSNAGK